MEQFKLVNKIPFMIKNGKWVEVPQVAVHIRAAIKKHFENTKK